MSIWTVTVWTVAVSVLASGRGRDTFLLKCTRHVWLTCAQHQVDLNVIHEPGVNLTATAYALSRRHLGPVYDRRAQQLIKDCSLTVRSNGPELFQLRDNL